tara:strand:- start:4909 stop:6384 length:1476 start_codon:yes stop_codon:yes gene_type:complete
MEKSDSTSAETLSASEIASKRAKLASQFDDVPVVEDVPWHTYFSDCYIVVRRHVRKGGHSDELVKIPAHRAILVAFPFFHTKFTGAWASSDSARPGTIEHVDMSQEMWTSKAWIRNLSGCYKLRAVEVCSKHDNSHAIVENMTGIFDTIKYSTDITLFWYLSCTDAQSLISTASVSIVCRLFVRFICETDIFAENQAMNIEIFFVFLRRLQSLGFYFEMALELIRTSQGDALRIESPPEDVTFWKIRFESKPFRHMCRQLTAAVFMLACVRSNASNGWEKIVHRINDLKLTASKVSPAIRFEVSNLIAPFAYIIPCSYHSLVQDKAEQTVPKHLSYEHIRLKCAGKALHTCLLIDEAPESIAMFTYSCDAGIILVRSAVDGTCVISENAYAKLFRPIRRDASNLRLEGRTRGVVFVNECDSYWFEVRDKNLFEWRPVQEEGCLDSDVQIDKTRRSPSSEEEWDADNAMWDEVDRHVEYQFVGSDNEDNDGE